MTAKRITERVSAPFTGCRVNRDAGTIDNVLICGTASANGRDYPVSVFRRDYTKYEMRPVNCDHGSVATVDRRFGWFSDVKIGPDGRPRGTLNCLKSHPMYERVMEAAERNPTLFGFSHVAICRTKPGTGGREVVEAIESVESIDLVAEPATTKSLFEGKIVRLTVKQLAEALVKHPRTSFKAVRALKWLAEMDGMDAVPATLDAPADDAEPGAALDQAFLDAAVAEMRECMAAKGDPEKLKKCLGKLKKMLQAHAEIVAADADDDDESDTDDTDDTDISDDGTEYGKESKHRRHSGAIRETFDAHPGIGFAGFTTDLEPAAKPTSTGRGRISEAVSGTGAHRTTESKPPTEGKAFADWIKE
jgi:hypothetical protein